MKLPDGPGQSNTRGITEQMDLLLGTEDESKRPVR